MMLSYYSILINSHPQPPHILRYVKTDKADTSDCRIGDGAYGVVYRALDVLPLSWASYFNYIYIYIYNIVWSLMLAD